MRASLILSCDGRVDEGFRFCSGVNNVLLNFENIQHTPNYRSLIEYLDINSKLFEGSCFSINIISNTLHKIFELGYLNEKAYNLAIQFFQFHKRCGLCLKIEPVE